MLPSNLDLDFGLCPIGCLIAGCHPAQVPLATKLVIARVSSPHIVLLTAPASDGGKDDQPPLYPQPATSDSSGHTPNRLDRTAEAETSDNGIDEAQEKEQLVDQLQKYFHHHTRYTNIQSTFCVNHSTIMAILEP